DAAALTRVKQSFRNLLLQDANNPFAIASAALLRSLYRDHPAGRTAVAPLTLDAVTVDEMRSLHRQRYTPRRALLAISGDVRYDRVRRAAMATFGEWSIAGDRRQPGEDAAAPSTPAIQGLIRPDSVQTNLLIGARTVPRRHRDYDALLVMNQIIGAGPTGRL